MNASSTVSAVTGETFVSPSGTTSIEVRHASDPEAARHFNTVQLRRRFLIETLFRPGQVALTYMRLPSAKTTVKMQIKVAYDAAYDALVAAQADADAGRPVNAAAVSAAIASLQAILATLPKGN